MLVVEPLRQRCPGKISTLDFRAVSESLFRELMLHANTLTGADAYCFKAFAEALEIIPYTLAENAGLNPIGKLCGSLAVLHILRKA